MHLPRVIVPRSAASRMKLPQHSWPVSFAAALLASVSPLVTASASAQGLPLASQTFVDWCQRRDRLQPATQQTIDLMLRAVGTDSCQKAHRSLSKTTELTIPNGRLSDLEPIAFYPQLTSLTIRENAIRDLTPLTKLTQLRKLDLSGQPEVSGEMLMALRTTEFIDPNLSLLLPPVAAQGASPGVVRGGGGAPGESLDLRLGVPRVRREKKEPTWPRVQPATTWDPFGEQAKGETLKDRQERLKREALSKTRQNNPLPPEALLRPEPLNQISDLRPLMQLPYLQELYLGGNNITDIRPLVQLPNLQVLSLHSNPLSYIEALRDMPQLRSLDLHSIKARSFGPLMDLRDLHSLNLANNQLKDVKQLQWLKELRDLDISMNELRDIRPIKYLEKLERLNIDHNRIASLKPIGQTVSLRRLYIRDNDIVNLHPIQGLTKLQRLLAWDNPLDRPMCPVRRVDMSSSSICTFRNPGGVY